MERMFAKITPLLTKYCPQYCLVHLGTNDSNCKLYNQIYDELFSLKRFIQNISPDTVVILSKPIMRTDNANANLNIRSLNAKLNNAGVLLLDNDNLREEHLGVKGLHLNDHGNAKLAVNIIRLIRRL